MFQKIKDFTINYLGFIYTIILILSIIGVVYYFNHISHQLTVEQSYKNGYKIARDLLRAKDDVETTFDIAIDNESLVLSSKSTVAKSNVKVEKEKTLQMVSISGNIEEIQEFLDLAYLSQLYAYPEAYEKLTLEVNKLKTNNWELEENNASLSFTFKAIDDQISLIIKTYVD